MGSDHHQSTPHFSRVAITLIALLVLLPWLVVFVLLQHQQPVAPAPVVSTELESPDSWHIAKPGPWGDLAYRRVVIEPPESSLPLPGATGAPHVWTFRGQSIAQLLDWFATVPLPADLKAELTDSSRWEIAAEFIRLHPTDATVAALPPEARAKIYTFLSDFPENAAQNGPFRFRADIADEWFRDSGLRPETIALVKKFLYRRGTALLFSDTNLVLPQLASQAERVRLIKTLSRKSTLMMRLRLRPDTDIDAIAAYWSRGQRSRDLEPLLRSLQPRQGLANIDIIHLLPRQPRQRLYTYPTPDERGATVFMDCHWTSLNFFTAQSEPRLEDIDSLKQSFADDYYLVTSKPTFGDILMLTRQDNTVLHSCVYLADDIVYTKNGLQTSSPWILMTLSDVVAYYPSDEALDVQVYRAKRATAP